MINLITTDSYFNIFNILVDMIAEKERNVEIGALGHNLVFCEEKVSLMIERMLCYNQGGSFNTDVYSFGNYLRANIKDKKVLSKEGSSMAVQRILRSLPLKLFKSGKSGLAPTIYDLIIQLKSAKVTPADIFSASENTSGLLKNKLIDIYNVYSSYESYISENGFDDQSSILSYLDDILINSDEVAKSNIFIVGFTGFTAQIRSAISILMDKGLSFTAILTSGENEMAFVNETSDVIEKMSSEKGLNINKKFVASNYSPYGNIIKDCLFNPVAIKYAKQNKSLYNKKDNKIYFKTQRNIPSELKSIGEIIKTEVMSGNCRYRDITIAVPDTISYGNNLRDIFSSLEIPYFLDEKKKPDNHPLITLILSYIDMFRKGFDRTSVADFFKNPLFSSDKQLNDRFDNYILKYNIGRNKFKEPFTLFDYKENEKEINGFREKLVEFFDNFSVREMLDKISAEDKISEFSTKLEELGYMEEKAVNDQIYSAVINILDEMDAILKGVKLNLTEYRTTFLSGVSALKLSIIPQYNDAVFVGNYKEVALYKAKYLFCVGLTSAVPDVKKDVAILSDNDIDVLSDIKVMIEPKIKIVNHRTRENIALALSAFNERLYLTYPVSALNGEKNSESEVLYELKSLFDFNDFPEINGYLTFKEGVKTFAKDCGEFAECVKDEIMGASSFYDALKNNNNDKRKIADNILDNANSEIKVKLNGNVSAMIDRETSPTLLEQYYECPYSVFAQRILKVSHRDEGGIKDNSLGSLMHAVFSVFALKIKKDESFDVDKAFEQSFDEVMKKNDFKKFLSDATTNFGVEVIKEQCRKYCTKIYLSVFESDFNVAQTEAEIGDGLNREGKKKAYPALPIADGKVKITGSIDRVDESDDYFRIIDYKTGKYDESEKCIFNGTKLQLYLYSSAVNKVMKGKNKKLAGCYYFPAWENYSADNKEKKFSAGRVLDEEKSLIEQGADPKNKDSGKFLPISYGKNAKNHSLVDENTLNDYVEYALKISSLAVKRMNEGVIVPSPYNEAKCEYCEFKSFCGFDNAILREIKKVDSETITKAIEMEKEKEGGKDND